MSIFFRIIKDHQNDIDLFQELIAEEGLEILLDINTKGNPTPEISWLKDDQIVTLDDRYLILIYTC